MKKLIILLFLMCIYNITKAQQPHPKYDAEQAKLLGADEYGMRAYVLVILKTGSNKTASKALTDSAFRGHMNNIKKLANEGKLIVAGPLQKNEKSYRGIFILSTPTIDEAKKLVDTDPAVSAKILEAEYYGWYGSAALPTYLKVHETIEKTTF